MSNPADQNPNNFYVHALHTALGEPYQQVDAVVNALLAIAGELRTANLIAYWTASEDGTFSRMLNTNPVSDIRDRLGIQ